MMNSLLRYIISFLVLISLWQCTERIDIEVNSTYTRLVVEGYVTTDTMQHQVRLTRTSDYFNNQPASPVSDALVRIDDGHTLFTLTEKPDIPGVYVTAHDFHGIPGKTYTLMISQVDIDNDGQMEEYSASSELYPVLSVDYIMLELLETPYYSIYQVRVFAQDPPERNFYAFKLYKNGRLLTDSLSNLIVQDDLFFNGNYTYGIPSQFLNQQKEDEKISPGDTVTFELNGITKEYYNFILEAQSEIFYQTPLFSGPPANISTNLSNGAIGFFTAYSIDRCSTVLQPDK
jgi:hypothetical protein